MTRALVIDDDDIARELLVSILRDGGYDTFELPSPIGATQTIFNERIDIVVLDVMMPALSGDKLAKMLRSNPRLSTLAIVLVSSCGMEELKELANSVKADAIVSKAEVRRLLLTAVSRARISQPPQSKPPQSKRGNSAP
jgi:CheY-like chemotaxis protein